MIFFCNPVYNFREQKELEGSNYNHAPNSNDGKIPCFGLISEVFFYLVSDGHESLVNIRPSYHIHEE